MKKFISLVLSACMVFALVPTVSFAAVTNADVADEVQAEAVLLQQDVEQDQGEEDVTLRGGDAVQEDPGLRGNPADGWYQDPGTGNWQYYTGGQYVTGKQQLGSLGKYYFFKADTGFMQTGWVTMPDNSKNYYDPTGTQPPGDTSVYGTMKTGWQLIDGSRYYLDPTTGNMYTDWKTIDGSKYYFGTDGKMATGWRTIGTSKYYFGTDGKMRTGWQTINGSRYYFSTDGSMYQGWLTYSGKRYFLSEVTGKMITGWKTINDVKYYFEKNGVMHTGWLTNNGHKYYFGSSGGMYRGTIYKIGNNKYYFASNGVMKTGKLKINGYYYYFKPSNGAEQTGFVTISGKKYYFNPSNAGRMVTSTLKKINKKKYYFDSNGVMASNKAVKISGSLYYFYKDGHAVNKKGWFKGSDKKKRYSLGKSGKVATGTKKIGSIWYQFSTTTGILNKTLGDDTDRQVQSMSSGTQYLIVVMKSNYTVRVYHGSKNDWSRNYTFSCAVGKSSPSKGTFTIKAKVPRHDYTSGGNPVHYYNLSVFSGSTVGINGPVYNINDGIYDGRLGGKYTGGNVRLSANNAAWVYNNCSVGTKVIVK